MDHRIGPHQLSLDKDVAWITYQGDATLAEMQEFCRLMGESSREYGYLVIIVDLAHAGTLSAEGRRFMAGWLNSTHSEGIFIGTRVVQRAIVAMVDRASEGLGGRERQPHFVGSADDARALIPEARARLLMQAAKR